MRYTLHINKLTLKTFFAISMLAISVFLLCGCSNQEPQSDSEYNVSYLSNNNTTSEISYEEVLLSDYSTKLIGSDKNRNTNIELACNAIDGTIIESGDTFSFWDIVEKTTVEKGYKEADAFDSNGETIHALGGGICQISSTLYNAVLEEDSLEVVERHPHSQPVAYVEEGKDATVNYGTSDFKFKNNSDFPIKIYTRLEEKEVIVEIYELK